MFKVMKFEIEWNEEGKINKRKYVLVSKDLKWEEAKVLRRAVRGSQIVKQ